MFSRPVSVLVLALTLPLLLGNEECGAGPWDVPEGAESSDHGSTPLPGGDPLPDVADLVGDCAPVKWLACGETVSGDSASPNSGHTTVIDGYPGTVGNYGGPEVAFAFRSTLNEPVSWSLIGARPSEVNHDLFVLTEGDGTCRAANSQDRGFNSLEFDGEAGSVYFLVLDSFTGREGGFEVSLECEGGGESGPWTPASADIEAEVIFSPQPYETSHLARTADEIDAAESTLDVAMYSFRDNGVQEALDRAAARGVSIRALLQGASDDRKDPEGTKSAALEDLGIEVRWINKIMHHKFAIIDGPRTDGVGASEGTLVTGSANWSWSAGTKYDENTTFVTGDSRLNLQFQREFDRLWDNARLVEWNETIAPIVGDEITDADIDAASGADAAFTSDNFKVRMSTRYGPTFSNLRPSSVVRDELVAFIESAQTSIHIASGHLRSRQIVDALLHVAGDRPGVDIRVYLDAQEYTSQGRYQFEEAAITECLTAAANDTDRARCNDKGVHFGYALHAAGLPLRYKSYSYRWHYSYAVQMHHKYIVVDGDRVASGSYNISPNAEFDTMENIIFYERDLYPGVVDSFVANFADIWDTGRAGVSSVIDGVRDGTSDVELTWESMAVSWTELTELKEAIRGACSEVDSPEFRSEPQANLTCTRD
jgi:phosphatidylserine/phosphatidylglycerophosphate/cardiolipin synthase-like enzyme